jgi:hypothetical protein
MPFGGDNMSSAFFLAFSGTSFQSSTRTGKGVVIVVVVVAWLDGWDGHTNLPVEVPVGIDEFEVALTHYDRVS